jgi:hypothetical protein
MHLGPWRVLNLDRATLRARFHRFAGDELNDWNEAKQSKAGQLGLVTEIYDDDTVTMVFEDLSRWDFPVEALEAEPPANVRGFRFVVGDDARAPGAG